MQYFAVHKPPGVVSTTRDPSGRPRVIDLLPPGVGRMFNVGRLDMASEGLILVTNDGPLANQLTHPRHGVEKIYEVQVAGQPAPDVLAQVKRGVHLSDGFVHAVDVRIKSSKKGSTLLEMVLDEGRNREVRRLLARLGHKVQRLIRVAVGPIRLGELPRGAVRMLTHEEVKKLRDAAAAGPKPEAADSALLSDARRAAAPADRNGLRCAGNRPRREREASWRSQADRRPHRDGQAAGEAATAGRGLRASPQFDRRRRLVSRDAGQAHGQASQEGDWRQEAGPAGSVQEESRPPKGPGGAG